MCVWELRTGNITCHWSGRDIHCGPFYLCLWYSVKHCAVYCLSFVLIYFIPFNIMFEMGYWNMSRVYDKTDMIQIIILF